MATIIDSFVKKHQVYYGNLQLLYMYKPSHWTHFNVVNFLPSVKERDKYSKLQ